METMHTIVFENRIGDVREYPTGGYFVKVRGDVADAVNCDTVTELDDKMRACDFLTECLEKWTHKKKFQRLGKVSFKAYQCRQCKAEKEEQTNHWGTIYPYCEVCMAQTTWDCNEDPPEGFTRAKAWGHATIEIIRKPRGV